MATFKFIIVDSDSNDPHGEYGVYVNYKYYQASTTGQADPIRKAENIQDVLQENGITCTIEAVSDEYPFLPIQGGGYGGPVRVTIANVNIAWLDLDGRVDSVILEEVIGKVNLYNE